MRAPDPTDPHAQLLARFSPAAWGWFSQRGRFTLPPHVDLLDQAIVETVESGGRLMVEMPPRHFKSETCCRATPGWFLGRFPDRRVAIACGALSLAKRASRMARNDFLRDGQAVWGLGINPDQAAAHDWAIDGHEGGMRAYGVGSQFSGEGADLLICDDLILDPVQAFSDVQRDAVWDWIESVAFTRLHKGAAVISIMTRWHEDDPHGRFRERMAAEGWRTIRLPALAEDGDPLGRKPGEALLPSHYSRDRLLQIRASKDPYWWSALYQQSPTPDAGGVWKSEWWDRTRYVVEPDGAFRIGADVWPRDGLWKFVVVDLATSLKSHADFTVIMVFGLTPPLPGRQRHLLLLDVRRKRMEGPDVNPAVTQALKDWNAKVAYYEDEGQQLTTIQYARRAGIPVRTVGRKEDCDIRLTGDKMMVAMDATPFMAAGRFHVPMRAPWLSDWEREMLSFSPAAAHDDQADVTAWGIHVAVGYSHASGPPKMTLEPARRELNVGPGAWRSAHPGERR